METAIKKMKIIKAAGHDMISPEMVKYMCKEGNSLSLRTLRHVWKEKRISRHWEISVFAPIYKKGGNRLCENHRGISLFSIPRKIYARILKTRLGQRIEHQLEGSQCGFRPS